MKVEARVLFLVFVWCAIVLDPAVAASFALGGEEPQRPLRNGRAPPVTTTKVVLHSTPPHGTENHSELVSRRAFGIYWSTVAAASSWMIASWPGQGHAAETTTKYQKQTNQYGFEFQVPTSFEAPSNKPLKTHLDEVNFKSSTLAGYQYGITVDPVRIASLASFGTPEEVAAKVVLAEVNRDGVFEVTLMKDPVAAPNNAFYVLNYLSTGKRGDKRFVTKFYIQQQMLYALTAQCKEGDYATVQAEMDAAVESFHVI